MKTIYLMRHGQTLFNVAERKQGWCDSPLTQEGIKQAKGMHKIFEERGISFDHAYCSTSERASDTLELMSDLPYLRLKGLKEVNFGTREGTLEKDNPRPPLGDHYVQFGGESVDSAVERFNRTLNEIMAMDNEKILVVAHGAIIANFLRKYDDISPCKAYFPIKNCTVFVFEYGDDGLYRCIDRINPEE